jgi:hypothetical protein
MFKRIAVFGSLLVNIVYLTINSTDLTFFEIAFIHFYEQTSNSMPTKL